MAEADDAGEPRLLPFPSGEVRCRERLGGLLRLLNVDIGLILHGEQHYDYFAPVHVGDKITCQQKVTDMYDKKGGALWFVVSETSLKNQAGKLVAKGTGITVVRNPDAAKK